MLIMDNRVRTPTPLFKTEASAFGKSNLFKIDVRFILNDHLPGFGWHLINVATRITRLV